MKEMIERGRNEGKERGASGVEQGMNVAKLYVHNNIYGKCMYMKMTN